jgi:Sulfotransferase family
MSYRLSDGAPGEAIPLAAPIGAPRAGGAAEPVFVLCGGRSGSTLLRFLLDEHPDLACPPETNLPGMAVQLATVWSLIEGAPLSAERGDEPPVIPAAAIRGVRRTMDEMTGSYLARRGKKRYCDKSLGTARFAELLLRIYPEAKFLCLYRHPMDVVASGVEACPWGLNGYGFDPYIASTPGNVVLALARFWTDNAAAIVAVEDRFPASCDRVRYEDLVTDPENVADRIFKFLGVQPEPGISARCFAGERERFGPGDYKIWHTSQITTESLGRGWAVPVGMIPLQIRDQMNELAARLGYRPVDDGWGATAAPADLRADVDLPPLQALPVSGAPLPGATLIGDRLRAGLSAIDSRFTQRWNPCSADTFTLVATASADGGPSCENRWWVNLADRTVTDQRNTAVEDTGWDIVGSAEAWQAVLSGRVNFGVALRRCELRYCDTSETTPVAGDTRIGMLADLLGLRNPRQAD